MMLIVLVLVAWSSANAASAMPEDVIRTTYDFTTSNITYTLASVSNADMESKYSDDKPEERAIEPATIDDILKSFFEPNTFEKLSYHIKRDKLSSIKKIREGLLELIDSPEMFKGNRIIKWRKNVSELLPDKVDEATLKLLATHFESEHALTSALTPAMTYYSNGQIVKNLLELQVTKWIHDKLDESKVFEELKLHKTNGDPLNSPVFFQWFNFVEKSYSSDKAYEVILKRVLPYYKTMNALVGALDAAASIY
ncbi:hypothetical protein KXD40_004246 [Peronospora effusa]|uniref:RxLR effector protein n=1 Tax=Peronospora effusa TaxID=542832 RepID=A0A3M6V6K3_9STRA|nr:hypothetical protein DD238_007974 [Peronospora effusa]RQM12661.1 hypothetical protein DD237_007716 [Peronospora effusa]UIZ28021.1 hypothetical protein KXD40_004246 [Peronospora effusa]CAI5701173.1 unnamed protein product [Peronospora effusa]